MNTTTEANSQSEKPSVLAIPLKKNSDGDKPFFMVSGLGGHILTFQIIVRHMVEEWKPFGLLYPGYAATPEKYDSLETLSERMLRDVQETQPEGPYLFVGYSMGGLICLEMAKLLKKQGKKVGVVLIDVKIFELAPSVGWHKRLPILIYGRVKNHIRKKINPKFKAVAKSGAAYDGNFSTMQIPEAFKRVFKDGQNLLEKYSLSPCDVDTVLIRSRDIIWYDHLRKWLPDYGWSRYTNLKTVLYSDGDHLEMVKPPNTTSLCASMDEAFKILLNED